MTNITQEQARDRFTTLPAALQDAIFSDQNSSIIADIAESNNLIDDRAEKLPEMVGWVLLGFIHPEDLAEEIRDQLLIPIQSATDISNELNVKIFSQLKGDIDRAYAPAPSIKKEEVTEGPKIMREIEQVVPVGTQKIPTPGTIFVRPAANQSQPLQQPPIAKPLSEAGWSKMSQPIVAPPTVSPQPIKNTIPSAPKPFEGNLQKIDAGKIYSTGDTWSRGPSPAPTPSSTNTTSPMPPQQKAPEPAPVMMQGDSSVQPVVKAPQFKIASDDKMASVRAVSAPMKPAVLEFGSAKPQASAPRVVNYTSSATIPAATKPSSQEGRSITEITAPSAAVMGPGGVSPQSQKPATPGVVPSIPIPKPPSPPDGPAPIRL